jgi:acetyl-CoA synthetase
MSPENYEHVVGSFDWSTVYDALGWTPGEKVSLGESIVDRHVGSDRSALIAVARDGTERRLSYRDISRASNRFAHVLRQAGVGPGDRVAGLMPRGPEVVIAIIGVLKLGAIYVPVFTGFGPDSIAFRLDHSESKILVTHQDVLGQLPREIKTTGICVSKPGSALPERYLDFWQAMGQQPANFQCHLADRNDTATIIYTSGSTGQPKGGAIAANFLAAIWPYIVYGLDLRQDDVFWPTGDPGWGYGFVCYLGALAAGGTVICVEQNPDAELCLSILARYRVTNLATTPTLLRSLLVLEDNALGDCDHRLRAISSCGEPLNSHVVESFRRVWNLTPMDHFGATEFAIPIGNFNAVSKTVKAGSMGLPFPGYRMAIVGADGSELPVGEVGLIGQKADANCRYWLRYWNDSAATSELVRLGWIATGDLGRRDEDGYFWFEGRAGDMIKSAGYRIGPFEVESALLKHPAVAEAAVVGKPDEMRGQIVKAYVVLRPGFLASDTLSEELAQSVKASVGRHQYPRLIEYLDVLPKTETGKIQRFALRERL